MVKGKKYKKNNSRNLSQNSAKRISLWPQKSPKLSVSGSRNISQNIKKGSVSLCLFSGLRNRQKGLEKLHVKNRSLIIKMAQIKKILFFQHFIIDFSSRFAVPVCFPNLILYSTLHGPRLVIMF